MKVIRESEFEIEVLQNPGKVLVDFYSDWCDSCRDQAPILECLEDHLEGLNGEVEGIKFVKVNIDESLNLTADYRIINIPTLFLFEGGKPVHRVVGLQWENELRKLLNGRGNGKKDEGGSSQYVNLEP